MIPLRRTSQWNRIDSIFNTKIASNTQNMHFTLCYKGGILMPLIGSNDNFKKLQFLSPPKILELDSCFLYCILQLLM